MTREARTHVIDLALGVAQWAAFAAPVLGLLVFWVVPFKPAVTLYALIAGLGVVLPKAVDLVRTSREIEEIARREVYEYYAH